MIRVKNYTCSVCGQEVQVTGIIDPEIIFSCSHQGSVVHANLEGTVFGQGAMSKLLMLSDLPEEHQAEFQKQYQNSALIKDGHYYWTYSQWNEYIENWHKEQYELDKLRRNASNI